MNNQCLICGNLTDGNAEYHQRCAKTFFGSFPPPSLEMSLSDLREFAARSVLARISVTGVQKKLSLAIEKQEKGTRFTIVGLWGNFILKPPVDEYPFLPENENTIMKMASAMGIAVVPHALIRLASGELAFVSRRIDRELGDTAKKIAMEDFCQISERMTEDKYKGSVERIGKLILRHSVYPGLDAVDFFERVVFSYICGNADMHLKNYSLIETAAGMRLSPAYDLVSTALVIPDDAEESALTINGKKSRFKLRDFASCADALAIPQQAWRNVFKKYQGMHKHVSEILQQSCLPLAMKEHLDALIQTRAAFFSDAI